MSALEPLFAGGAVVDLALLVLAVEAIGLRLQGRGLAWISAALAPGAFLLLALKAALLGAGWPWVAAPLAAALPAHLWDLARRRA